ncbi:hypothetical protein LPB248_09010 [Flavobacterium sp. LPB0248]|uniref:hypothetical protein n=1 Tax=Flavobacterium sp. LPB0248 TaxID=2614441 RepID=UPI0015A532CC|nr:hypothetical protein [Flavobacterium sp. LPB0248]QLC66419.1 hypothetical protein LPB248_09010 [Flavobacterium sp. LPB0248]
MKNYKKKIIYLSIFASLLKISYAHSQSTEKSSLYDYFDEAVGKDNLNINNGIIHSESFRPLEGKNRYYIDEFNLGDISFEGQIYSNVNLKYDILVDQVIYKQNGSSENAPINLINNKVDYFFIKNKKFVNLKEESVKFPSIIKGIYEETYIGDNVSLYIKHTKEKVKSFQADIIYYNFIYKIGYVLKYNNYFYKVETEKDFKKIFPNLKKEISNIYSTDKKLERSNKPQFMENLTKQINGLLKKSSN